MRKVPVFFVIASMAVLCACLTALAMDGKYAASVTTGDDSYDVLVNVKSGEVVSIEWPNGQVTSLSEAFVNGTEATGYDDKGNLVDIDLYDYAE